MEKKRRASPEGTGGRVLSLVPVYVLPAAAGMTAAVLLWGDEFRKWIHVLIKLVVKA